jgi:hypothetical protein
MERYEHENDGRGNRVSPVTTKEIALRTIEQLPESASWEDVHERINFVAAVDKGLRELDEGKGIPHCGVKLEFGGAV